MKKVGPIAFLRCNDSASQPSSVFTLAILVRPRHLLEAHALVRF